MRKKITGFKICSFQSDELVFKISPTLIKDLKIDLTKPLILRFGSSSTPVTVFDLENPSSENTVQISEGALKKLKIPKNIQISILPVGDQEFRLGPVIGILIFRHVYRNQNFQFYLHFHERLKHGFLYVFSVLGIDTRNQTIKGYYYNDYTKSWTEGEFPYPDAIIDRCYPNAYQAHKKIEDVIGAGKIFNKTTLINKLDFYNALSKDSFLSSHLPETSSYTEASDLKNFLEKYGEVFLKPLNGMKGIGIITASLTEKGIKCRYLAEERIIEKNLTTAHNIYDILQKFNYPKTQYIIQKAVPRMKYLGNPFCFRVMVCKKGGEEWLAPAIFPKTATGNSFLTNHASGARFVPLKDIFKGIKHQLRHSEAEFISLIQKACIKAANVLDKSYGPLGILGLDVVVDHSGKPWLIEANGNPGMVPKSHQVEFPDWSNEAFSLPLSYAVYLAGFKPTLLVPTVKGY